MCVGEGEGGGERRVGSLPPARAAVVIFLLLFSFIFGSFSSRWVHLLRGGSTLALYRESDSSPSVELEGTG